VEIELLSRQLRIMGHISRWPHLQRAPSALLGRITPCISVHGPAGHTLMGIHTRSRQGETKRYPPIDQSSRCHQGNQSEDSILPWIDCVIHWS